MSGFSWKVQALSALSDPDAPRVFNREDLSAFLEQKNCLPEPRTLLRGLREWEKMGLAERVTRGVYLNKRATPMPLPYEAVARMREGAVLSLHSVLGQAGVLNNPTHWVTVVVPTTSTKGPTEIELDNGHFVKMAYMQPDFLPSSDQDWFKDALDPYSHAPTATPEKALMDWLYLAQSARGGDRWALPATHDLDLSLLDENRSNRLAVIMGLEKNWQELKDACENETPRVQLSRRRPGM